MRKTKILILLGASTLAVLSACSTLQTTVIPGKHHYTVIATAEDAPTARNGAVKKATETCSKQGKQLVVTKQDTIYQGAGKTLGTVTEIASMATFHAGGPFLRSTKQGDDYKSTMTFNCQ